MPFVPHIVDTDEFGPVLTLLINRTVAECNLALRWFYEATTGKCCYTTTFPTEEAMWFFKNTLIEICLKYPDYPFYITSINATGPRDMYITTLRKAE
jgi:hypothetical protein